MRAFFIENARYWIEHYHFDGIRFDAIAMIHDPSPTHIMNEVGALYQKLSKKLGRHIHAIGESNIYQPEFLPEHGGAIHALWSDDIGHAAEASVTHINTHSIRYYNGPEDLLSALQQGSLYYRTEEGYAERHPHDAAQPVIERCVNQLQNHDIVGNSPYGKRIHQYTTTDTQRALAALILLYPTPPILFMGKEFSANGPFLFFTDFESPELRTAVEQGRAREFPLHSWEEAISPTSPEAFYLSKLPPQSEGEHSSLTWYKAHLRERKAWQRESILCPERLNVIGDSDNGLFVLNYTHPTQPRFVAAKLHHGADQITVTGADWVHLQSGNAYLKNGKLTLQCNDCVIGSGNIRM